MRKIVLCPWCIQGLTSHMEKIYTGERVETEDSKCEMCHEESDELIECVWNTEEDGK